MRIVIELLMLVLLCVGVHYFARYMAKLTLQPEVNYEEIINDIGHRPFCFDGGCMWK